MQNKYNKTILNYTVQNILLIYKELLFVTFAPDGRSHIRGTCVWKRRKNSISKSKRGKVRWHVYTTFSFYYIRL